MHVELVVLSCCSTLKNKPPMVVTVHKLKPMEFFYLLGYSMIYIWIGNSKGHCLNNAKYFFTKLAIIVWSFKLTKTALWYSSYFLRKKLKRHNQLPSFLNFDRVQYIKKWKLVAICRKNPWWFSNDYFSDICVTPILVMGSLMGLLTWQNGV